LLPERPRDWIALAVAVGCLIVVLVTVTRLRPRPLVDDATPFEVPEQLAPLDADRSSEGRRVPSRPLPDAPAPVPEGGWVDLESGLDVYDTAPGEGPAVREGRPVRVDYTIFVDGQRVYSTFESRDPVRFVVGRGGVVPGIDEAIRPMRPGGRRQIRIPPELGYGSRGRGRIPPNATLRVDLQLLEVIVPRTEPPSGLDYAEIRPGLQRAVFTPGEGRATGQRSRVELDYAMWVEGGDAAPIDQSYERTESFVVNLGRRRLLRGWSVGMQDMRPGSRFVLRIAPELAFGAEGRPPIVPPNATILIDVTLRDVR